MSTNKMIIDAVQVTPKLPTGKGGCYWTLFNDDYEVIDGTAVAMAGFFSEDGSIIEVVDGPATYGH